MNNLKNYFSKTTGLFFILLYPIYVIYNTLLAYGFISPFLGGFYGVVSLTYLFSMVPILFFLTQKVYVNNYKILLFLFISYICIVVLINYFTVNSHEIILAAEQSLGSLILLFSAILLGYYLEHTKLLKKILTIFLIMSLTFLIVYVIKTGEVMFYAKTLDTAQEVNDVSTYQGYGRTFFIISLLLLAMIKEIRNFIFIYFISLFILFVLGSRSELVACVIAGFLLILIKYPFSIKSILSYSIVILFSIVSFSFFANKFSDNRSLQLLNASESSSWQSREVLTEIAINHIKSNPILGYFGGHVVDGGSIGAYAHNILSSWANYGFFAFIIYTALCLIPLVHSFYLLFFRSIKTSEVQFCFLLGISVFVLIIFSKPVFWFVPGFLFGCYLKVRSLNLGN